MMLILLTLLVLPSILTLKQCHKNISAMKVYSIPDLNWAFFRKIMRTPLKPGKDNINKTKALLYSWYMSTGTCEIDFKKPWKYLLKCKGGVLLLVLPLISTCKLLSVLDQCFPIDTVRLSNSITACSSSPACSDRLAGGQWSFPYFPYPCSPFCIY